MLAKRIKTHFINLIQIVSHNPANSADSTPYIRFVDKALSIKTTSTSQGPIFMQPFGNAILYKQEQGLELYKATICTFGQRYDLASDSCVACEYKYYSNGLQANTCTPCQDDYSELHNAAPSFYTATYSHACADYIANQAGAGLDCAFGEAQGGCVQEQGCVNGHDSTGRCFRPECKLGIAAETGECVLPECVFGRGEDGECLQEEEGEVVDPEEEVTCRYGKLEDGSCKEKYVEPTDVLVVQQEDASFPGWAIILIVCVVLLVIVIILCYLCGCCKQTEDQKSKGASEYNSIPGNKSIKVKQDEDDFDQIQKSMEDVAHPTTENRQNN